MKEPPRYRYEKRKGKNEVFANNPDFYLVIAPNGNHAGACMTEERAKRLTAKLNERQHTEENTKLLDAAAHQMGSRLNKEEG